jgi:peptidoglycan/LPS O-acetylase OafA/YrhL
MLFSVEKAISPLTVFTQLCRSPKFFQNLIFDASLVFDSFKPIVEMYACISSTGAFGEMFIRLEGNMRIRNLDALRAVAVMLVVVTHAGFSFIPGGMGVQFFFVLSGFVITRMLLSEYSSVGKFRAGPFFARRALKILPPLFGIVILPSFVLILMDKLILQNVMGQIFFYYNWINIETQGEGVLPGSVVVWSLSIEEQFYVFIAAVWFVLTKLRGSVRRLTWTLAGLWIFSTAMRVWTHFNSDQIHDQTGNLPRIYYGTDTRIGAIAFGCLLAVGLHHYPQVLDQIQTNRYRISTSLFFYAALLMFFISLIIRNEWFRDTLRYSIQEFAAAILIFACLATNGLPNWVARLAASQFVQSIGLGSYSIYLSHLTISHLIGLMDIDNVLVSSRIAPIALSVLGGLFLHRILDAPFEKYRRKFRLKI